MHKDILNIWDFFLMILYLLLIYIIFFLIKGNNIKEHPEYKYLLPALSIKIFGAITFSLVYIFYYGGGDTINYFTSGEILSNYLFKDPNQYFKLLFSSTNFSNDLAHIRHEIFYAKSAEEWFMVKIISVINIFSFNRYIISSLLMSLISLWGAWRLFQSFLLFNPKHIKIMFYAVFFTPSVIFWGSGILKDTISLSFISLFFYYSIKLFFIYQIRIKSIIILIISALVVFTMKAYILLSFLPVVLLGWIAYNRSTISNQLFRNLIMPIILVAIIYAGFILLPEIADQSEKYKIENLESRMVGFHMWHTLVGGSSYDLHVTDYSFWGIIKKIPASLNVTFYRPYLTEIRNASMAIGGFESTIYLIFSLFLLFQYRLKIISKIYKNPLLLMAFLYSILLGFAVGFTSYNFGALARYKIPVMPFFVYILLSLYSEYKADKRLKNGG